jgi:hypothetical protein
MVLPRVALDPVIVQIFDMAGKKLTPKRFGAA